MAAECGAPAVETGGAGGGFKVDADDAAPGSCDVNTSSKAARRALRLRRSPYGQTYKKGMTTM
jgi:hypothetical protein